MIKSSNENFFYQTRIDIDEIEKNTPIFISFKQ